MAPGVILALIAYGLFSCADALIKSTGGELSIFQVGFFTSTFGILPALVSKRSDEQWRDLITFRNPLLLHLRGILGVIGSACVIYAFTHIPMAEVYSLAFLAPMFVVLLSSIVLKETIPGRRWPLLILSFVGVVIVVRPGFQALELGHLAALACAFFTAANTIILRSLAPREHRLSIISTVTIYAVGANGVGMLLTGFALPNPIHLAVLMAIGTLGGIGHLTFINATRYAAANQIAPVQYTQMIWAIAFGAAFYGEYLDLQASFGIAILATAGLLNVLADQPPIGMVQRHRDRARRRASSFSQTVHLPLHAQARRRPQATKESERRQR
jgi:drug/metabolite transporter (DMT)-like permease